MERLARLDKLLHASKRKAVGLQGANIALNGVAESLIGYGLMKSVNTFFLMLETR